MHTSALVPVVLTYASAILLIGFLAGGVILTGGNARLLLAIDQSLPLYVVIIEIVRPVPGTKQ